MRRLDLDSWVRRPLFDTYRTYSDPFFNLTAEIDITGLHRTVGERRLSFFAASYYLVLRIANEIEEFRVRIRDDDAVIFDVVHGSCTVLNRDATFSFCFFEYSPGFREFERMCARVLEENERQPNYDPRFDRDDVVHSSIIPWVRFSSFEHAKRMDGTDSCPKVVLGKFVDEDDRVVMPVSVSAHHALMDGIHASMFFERYEKYAADPTPVFAV